MVVMVVGLEEEARVVVTAEAMAAAGSEGCHSGCRSRSSRDQREGG